jgi:hypothetical protein
MHGLPERLLTESMASWTTRCERELCSFMLVAPTCLVACVRWGVQVCEEHMQRVIW